jgi:RNA polymerase sigma factor (sigma-70 family)
MPKTILDNLEDIELIRKVKHEQCDESLKILINKYEKLYFDMFHSFKKILKYKQIIQNDLLNDSYINIYEAIISFDETKNTKFSTWLANSTRYKCLKLVYNQPNIESLYTEENKEKQIELENIPTDEDNNNEDTVSFVKELIENLSDDKAKQIFKLRFADVDKTERSWSSIGEKVGVSTQTAINIFNKNLKKVKYRILSRI